jgi:D-sedoheptulose 7-phosphate isomerase
MSDAIREHAAGLASTLAALPFPALARVEEAMMECYRRGGTVFLAGNGGSAATASHFACDLSKGTRHADVPRFRVVALTDNVPMMTAWANDANYECIFAEQLSSVGHPGDVLLLISASGSSGNIVQAARAAREMGMLCVALTGRIGGEVKGLADMTVCVPSDAIEVVEDAHSAITHGLTVALRHRLQDEAARASTASGRG